MPTFIIMQLIIRHNYKLIYNKNWFLSWDIFDNFVTELSAWFSAVWTVVQSCMSSSVKHLNVAFFLFFLNQNLFLAQEKEVQVLIKDFAQTVTSPKITEVILSFLLCSLWMSAWKVMTFSSCTGISLCLAVLTELNRKIVLFFCRGIVIAFVILSTPHSQR